MMLAEALRTAVLTRWLSYPSQAFPPVRASNTRRWVIVFAVSLATVQYIDRVAISQAMPYIGADLGLTDGQKGMVFSAFTLAYALFEIPTGWLGDKLGARRVLIRIVLWWSFFTAATGWAWNYVSMLVIRFLFGAGEAGCFPNLTRSFGFIELTGASVLLMTSFYIRDPLLAMLSMGLASFFNDLTMPGSWASCMDIGGKYAGTVSGSMNMMGNFGGMAGPLVVGVVLSFTDRNWQLVFATSSVVYFTGAIFWLFIDPVKPLERRLPVRGSEV